MFKLSKPAYKLGNKGNFVADYVKMFYFGTDSFSYLGPKLLIVLPQDLKALT